MLLLFATECKYSMFILGDGSKNTELTQFQLPKK